MSLPKPNLDDRTFTDLVAEMRALIPRYAPQWTDHNITDPGITLIELFAWLTEMILYRLNRIPDQSYRNFLALLGEYQNPAQAVQEFQKRYRAVSTVDFETLAIEANPSKIARARCLPNRNLEYSTDNETGHVTVLLVPKTGNEKPIPDDDLKKEVRDYLFPRRLITTRLHVLGPKYVDIGINFQVVEKPNVNPEDLVKKVRQGLRNFLDPISGGHDGKGWPFGRDIFISEIYQVIEETEGVDYTRYAELIASAQFMKPSGERVYLDENYLPWYVEAETS